MLSRLVLLAAACCTLATVCMSMPNTRTYSISTPANALASLSSVIDADGLDASPVRVLLRYQNPLHEVVSLHQVVCVVAALLGKPPVKFEVMFSQHPNLQARLISYSWVLRSVAPMCHCQHIGDEHKQDGHLLSAQFAWAAFWPAAMVVLQLLKSAGLSHVPTRPCVQDEILQEYCTVIPTLSAAWHVCPARLRELFQQVIAARCGVTSLEVQDTEQLAAGIAQLSNICAVTQCDKAKNHPVFMCKMAAYNRLHAILHNPAEFVRVVPNTQSIISSVAAIIPNLDLPELDTWAIPHEIWKPHKGTFRLICGYHRCMLTHLADVVSSMSAAVFDLWRQVVQLCTELMNKKLGMAVRLDVVVQDSLQAAVNVPRQSVFRSVTTADIVSCYDVVPIDPSMLMASACAWILSFV